MGHGATARSNEELCNEMLDFAATVPDQKTPAEILDHLHKITSRMSHVNVLGVGRMPSGFADAETLVESKSVFVHQSVSGGWWQEYLESTREHPSPIYAMAQLSLAPFTTTEAMRKLDPIGADRWSIELAQRHGMRDSLACPIGGRWLFGYWSTDVMTDRLTPQLRAMLFLGANIAVIRLQELIGDPATQMQPQEIVLTAREQAVLQALSRGNRLKEAAEKLGIGDETVRTHVKKALNKLNVKTQTHAVAKAIRQRLIP